MKKYFLRLERTFALGLCICAAICLTACGRKEVEYNTEEIGESGTGDTSGDATGNTADGAEAQNGIPQHMEDSLLTESGEITVDADVVNIGSYGKLPVATMEIKDWSEQDIKNYAEAVFDKGSTEVILPIGRWSKEALLDGEMEVEAKIKELGFTTETIYNSDEYSHLGRKLDTIRDCIENFDESNVLENDGDYHWVITEFSDEEGETVERASCQVKGTIGGKPYTMCVQKGGYEAAPTLCICQEVNGHYAEEVLADSPMNVMYMERLAPDSPIGTENICSITEQEAVKQAETFVDQMGIQGLAVSGVYQARQDVWKVDEETGDSYNESATKGYLVYFGREMGGVTTPLIDDYLQKECRDMVKKVNGAFTEIELVGTSYGYEWIIALVTDDGIEELQYANPMEIAEVTAEQAEVMDFAQIHKCAMQYMQENDYSRKIDKIELCMGLVRYEDAYALLPVWCYESDIAFSDVTSNRDGILINAIDGSIIDAQSGRPIENSTQLNIKSRIS